MPRLLLAALCAALIMPAIMLGVARAATPSIEAVVAVAESHGLTCDDPEDSGGGFMNVICVREVDTAETNIDLSVTYNAVGGSDGAGSFATVATYATPPTDWLDLATEVALLFCEDSGAAVEGAVAAADARTELAGCEIHTDTDSFTSTVTVIAAPTAPAAPATDLASYLASYGLECTDTDVVAVCRLELTDEEGLDATYEVATRFDGSGAVVAVDALVTSLDASMPSDAVGFLRGVAERAPVNEPADLVAWFDAALAGGTDPYASGDWAATWAENEVPPGRTLALVIERTEGQPVPASSDTPAAATPPPPPPPAAAANEPSFAASVATVGEVSADPIVLLQSLGLAALLVFLMPFPGQLFNSTLETHEDEVRRWFRLDRVGSSMGRIGAFWASWPGVALFTLLATTLYGFLDPGFGLTLDSAATFLGMLVGIVLVTAAFAVPAVVAHRRIGDRWTLKVVPLSLLIGVACVLLSRLTGFQPGYLYGLLIGLAFARELSAADEGRATAVSAVAMLAAAFAAWLVLGAVPAGDGFGVNVLRTALAALLVAGLEGVVFGLMPMRFLPGEPLYAWNRLLWAVLLGIGAFAFFHILINPASGYLSDTSRTPLFTVVALLLGFSLVSVAFWAWFRFRGSPPDPEPTAAASG